MRSGTEIKEPIPVVIFLHGHSYQLGYTGIYGLYGSAAGDGGLIKAMVSKHKVAVLAYDMSGMGMRQQEGASNFYRRYRSFKMAQHLNFRRALLRAPLVTPGFNQNTSRIQYNEG